MKRRNRHVTARARASRPVRAGLVLLLAAAAGCGPRRIHSYGGAERPKSEIAVVLSDRGYLAARYVMIESVDGVAVESGKMRTQEIEIEPGPHRLAISYQENETRSTSNASVSFVALAGHRYRAHGTSMKRGFWSEVRKNTIGGPGEWVAWIEEEPSGTVVGGKKPQIGVYTTTFE